MVRSGLKKDTLVHPEDPRVSPYRLATHVSCSCKGQRANSACTTICPPRVVASCRWPFLCTRCSCGRPPTSSRPSSEGSRLHGRTGMPARVWNVQIHYCVSRVVGRSCTLPSMRCAPRCPDTNTHVYTTCTHHRTFTHQHTYARINTHASPPSPSRFPLCPQLLGSLHTRALACCVFVGATGALLVP